MSRSGFASSSDSYAATPIKIKNILKFQEQMNHKNILWMIIRSTIIQPNKLSCMVIQNTRILPSARLCETIFKSISLYIFTDTLSQEDKTPTFYTCYYYISPKRRGNGTRIIYAVIREFI